VTRRIAALVAAVVVGLTGGTLAATSPAQAAASDCSAYPGTMCIFQFTGYSGRVWRQYPWQITGCRSLVPDDFNDRGTVFWNNTQGSHLMRIWQHGNCTGWYYDLPSQSVVDFASTPGYDNAASAVEDIEF